MAGVEQMPSRGQSWTRPAASLSWRACHRNLPEPASKHMTTPLSPVILSSFGFSLLVPMKILPPAITGPPYAFEPRSADHLTFFCASSWTFHSVGMSLSTVLTMSRFWVPPNRGQVCFLASSSLAASTGASVSSAICTFLQAAAKTLPKTTTVATTASQRRKEG